MIKIDSFIRNINIPNDEITNINNTPKYSFKKYVSPILNLANRFTHATSPKKIGIQLSDLFQSYLSDENNNTFQNWKNYCEDKIPQNAIDEAAESILIKCQEFSKVINSITPETVKEWVEDLLYSKTYNGLNLQHIILSKIAKEYNTEYIKATKEDESKGIDGYINNIAYSVKPKSYYVENPALVEQINAVMILYEKVSNGLKIEIYNKKVAA